MDDDLTRDVEDDVPLEKDEDDLDDNFDRELREAERELEEADQREKGHKQQHTDKEE